MITSFKSAPRWMIFLLDILCMVAAMVCAFLLRFNFNITDIFHYDLAGVFLSVLLVNTVVFIALRTYTGIIRHTSLQDAWRVLVALSASTFIYACINMVQTYYGEASFIPYSVILIAFFCSFALLIFYRLTVKVMYDQLFSGRTNRANVVVYGAGYAGMVTRSVLEKTSGDEPAAHVVAFIEDDAHKWGKKLEGVPVCKATTGVLEKLLKRYKFRQLIITDELLNSSRKNALVEWCLENNIKVQQVPPLAQWMRGGLNVKQIKDIRIQDLLNRSVIKINNTEISRQLEGKVVLITGASGSIGSELVRQMVAFNPERIILCDQAESPLHDLALEIKELAPQVQLSSFLGDIRNKRRIYRLFEQYHPQVVFHAAAYKHVPMMEQVPDVAILNNVMGTIHMAELSQEFGVEKFVMISTDKAVNPTNVMGASKRIAEIYIQSLNNELARKGAGKAGSRPTAYITTRFGNVLGSNGSVVPRFKQLIEKGGPITVTHPEVTRYFMTIPEACQLVLEAGTMGKGGEVFVFDMGSPVKITDLATKMIRLSGLVPEKDIKIVYTGLRPGEKLYEELLTEHENIVPTYHEKIRIARVREYDFEQVKEQIHELIETAQDGKEWEVVQVMKRIVPEYKSNNSIFEELDELVATREEASETASEPASLS